MSKPDTSTTDDTHSFADSADDYQTVLRIVDHNTGHKQPPMASRSSILQTAVDSAGLDSQTVHAKLGAAEQNGDLVTLRVGRTTKVARRTDAALRAIIAAENAKPPAERNEELMDTVRDLIREVGSE